MARVPQHLRRGRGERDGGGPDAGERASDGGVGPDGGRRDGHPGPGSVPDPVAPPTEVPARRARPWAPRPVRVGLGMRRRLGRRRIRLAVLLVLVAVVGAVAGGLWGWQLWQDRLAQQRRGTGVGLALDVPGYGEGSSPIPLRVTGTTEGGSSVAGVRIISQTQGWLSLYPGSYEVEAAGSPVTAEGGTFVVPDGTWQVTVGEQGGEVTAPDGSVGETLELSYVPVAPLDVTDEQVDAIRAWMVGLGVQGVDGYVSAVEQARGL